MKVIICNVMSNSVLLKYAYIWRDEFGLVSAGLTTSVERLQNQRVLAKTYFSSPMLPKPSDADARKIGPSEY